MRILVLGISGLIGHKLFQELSPHYEVYGTLHKSKEQYGNKPLFATANIIDSVNINEFEKLKVILASVDPDVILNCTGITKRKIGAYSPSEVLSVNSVFPHKLADWARENNKRAIHFSTDCVFDGKTGNYTEESMTTAEDFYGRTKALGEIIYSHTVTIRSSFIGQELFDKTELLEWFLAQEGRQIKGFTNTLYSGVSTIFMARIVKRIISDFPKINGLYNLAPEKPISKFELLCIARDAFHANVEIIPDETQIHAPTLNASRLTKKMNLFVPTWKEMMNELADNRSFYSGF